MLEWAVHRTSWAGLQQSLFCSVKSSAGTSPHSQGQQLVLRVTAQALGPDLGVLATAQPTRTHVATVELRRVATGREGAALGERADQKGFRPCWTGAASTCECGSCAGATHCDRIRFAL